MWTIDCSYLKSLLYLHHLYIVFELVLNDSVKTCSRQHLVVFIRLGVNSFFYFYFN